MKLFLSLHFVVFCLFSCILVLYAGIRRVLNMEGVHYLKIC